MSFHAGQTFTFGEQPSATKWGYIWENDYALADGSGISAGAVAFSKLGTDVGAFQLLADVTLSGAADSISSGTITARKVLRVFTFLIQSGAISSHLRFNNDSGANYAFIRDSGATTSDSKIGTGNSALDQWTTWDIFNLLSSPKPVLAQTSFGSASAAAAPAIDRVSGKWHNTSSQITRVDAVNVGAGDFAIGSRLIVLGRD